MRALCSGSASAKTVVRAARAARIEVGRSWAVPVPVTGSPAGNAGGLAEGDGGSGLVAGEDDGADALAGEALDCLRRAGFWRVGEAEESGQRQPGLPPGARFAAGFFADGAVGDREQPHAVVPQLLGDLAGLGTEGAAEGLLAAGEPHGRAGVQDGGDGALGDHQARAGAGVEDDAGAAAGEVKADLAGLVVLGLSNSRSSGWQAPRIAASREVRCSAVKTALSRA